MLDFNAAPENNDVINFMNNQCLLNLIKGPGCFKSANGSMMDLFLTTNKYLFQKKKKTILKQVLVITIIW